MKEPVLIPPVDQIPTLKKSDLDRVLEAVCASLYRLLDKTSYTELVLKEVRVLERGLEKFVEFVKKMAVLLDRLQQPQVISIR